MEGRFAKKQNWTRHKTKKSSYFKYRHPDSQPFPQISWENIKITYSSSVATITWMETINCVPLGFAPLCSAFQNPISSMSSRSTFIRALPLDYLPPSPRLPRCCMLQCIKLNEVSVQVTLVPAPPPSPNPPLFTAGNQGRGPLPAGVVPARLHKLALIGAGETCSKGGSEGQKAAKAKRKGETRAAAWRRTGKPSKGYVSLSSFCLPFTARFPSWSPASGSTTDSPPKKQRRRETVAAEVLLPNESWMRLCEHCWHNPNGSGSKIRQGANIFVTHQILMHTWWFKHKCADGESASAYFGWGEACYSRHRRRGRLQRMQLPKSPKRCTQLRLLS